MNEETPQVETEYRLTHSITTEITTNLSPEEAKQLLKDNTDVQPKP